MKDENNEKKEKTKDNSTLLKVGIMSAAAVAFIDIAFGPLFVSSMKELINGGISTVGLFNTTILGMVVGATNISAINIVSKLAKYMKEKKNNQIEKYDDGKEGKNPKVDFSQSKYIEKDSRFQGQENPPKIERQSPSQTQSRSQEDSREP